MQDVYILGGVAAVHLIGKVYGLQRIDCVSTAVLTAVSERERFNLKFKIPMGTLNTKGSKEDKLWICSPVAQEERKYD